MNKVYNARTNLPIYLGNFPSNTQPAPGLKPMRSDLFYKPLPVDVTRNNLDKITNSEQDTQFVTSNLGEKKEKSDLQQSDKELIPDFDTERKGGNKRKLENLFKVNYYKNLELLIVGRLKKFRRRNLTSSPN